jgi:hypothetical protein
LWIVGDTGGGGGVVLAPDDESIVIAPSESEGVVMAPAPVEFTAPVAVSCAAVYIKFNK